MGEYADEEVAAGMEELGYNGRFNGRPRIVPSGQAGYKKLHIQKNPGISYGHFLTWYETNSPGYEIYDLAEAAWMEAAKRVCNILAKPIPESCNDDNFTWWWDERTSMSNSKKLTQMEDVWAAWQEATKRANAR